MPEHATITEAFNASQHQFAAMLDFAVGEPAAGLEEQFTSRGRELLRQLYQDHLDLHAQREDRLAYVINGPCPPSSGQ